MELPLRNFCFAQNDTSTLYAMHRLLIDADRGEVGGTRVEDMEVIAVIAVPCSVVAVAVDIGDEQTGPV